MKKVMLFIVFPLLAACTDAPKSERLLELGIDQKPPIKMRAVDKEISGFSKENRDLIGAFEKVCPSRGSDTPKYFAELRELLVKRFGMQHSVVFTYKSVDGSGSQRQESEIRVSVAGESLTCEQTVR